MRRVLNKALILSFIGIFTSLTGISQTTVDLDSVEISATRSNVAFSKAARNIVVITKKDIEASAATSINELLEFTSSVDIRQRGQQGVQADISLRGSTFEQVLVLLNCIKMTDPQTGHHALNLPISLLDIERIEILHGGAARIYGPGAFAGSINIVTKNPEVSQAKIQVLAGENGLQQLGLSASVVEKNHSHSLSYLGQSSDGYIRNTDYQSRNLFWESNIKLKSTALRINLGQNNKEFGAQNFYTVNFPEQYEATTTQFASVSADIQVENLKITPRAYYRKHNDRFELLREGEGYYHRLIGGGFANNFGDTIGFYSNHNYHQTDVTGAEINFTYQSSIGKTSFGYDYRKEEILSTNLGEDIATPIRVEDEVPTAFYSKSGARENTSLYAEHTFSTEKFFASGGVLLNINSAFGDDFYPGIDLAYQVSETFRGYASVNKSFRFPSYTDLYYTLGGAIGSRDLKQEESVNYELGLKFNQNNGFGHIAVFRRDGENLIDWVRLNGSANTTATNLTEVRIEGVEVDYTTKKSGWISEVEWLNQVRLSYTFMQSDNNSEGFESNYVLDFLEHKGDVVLQFKLADKVSLDWSTGYQNRRGEFVDGNGDEQEYEGIFLSDLKISTQQKALNLFIQASNVFNEEYFDIGNVQNPGRWFSIGLKYQIDFKQ